MTGTSAERKWVHDTLHDSSEFESMVDEWAQYHGKKIDDVTGEEMTFADIRKGEKARLAESYLTELQRAVKGKELDAAHAKAQIMAIAKKAYLASIGLKPEDADKVKIEGLDEKVNQFLVSATGGEREGISTTEQAIEAIMTARDPFGIHDKEGMSGALQNLLAVYTEHTYKSDQLKARLKDGKEVAQTDRRLNYLLRELAHPEHREPLVAKYTPLLKQHYGAKAAYHKSAESIHVLQETQNLLTHGRISGLKKGYFVGVSGGKKSAKKSD